MNIKTLRSTLARDDVKAMQMDIAVEYLRNAAGKASKVLVQQMDDPNPWVAQQAARTVLQFLTTVDKAAETNVVVNFNNMPSPGMPSNLPPARAEVSGDGEVS